MLCIIGISFCDDVDLTFEAGEVRGFWESRERSGVITYLLVSDSNLIFYHYDKRNGCTTTENYLVKEIDEAGFFTVNKEGEGDQDRIFAISGNKNRVDVRDIDDSSDEIVKYFVTEITQVEVEDLAPECPDEEVFGTWKLDQMDREVYISISDQEIHVADFDNEQACYFFSTVVITLIDGNVFYFTVFNQNNEPTEEQAVLEVVDGVLKVSRTEEGVEIFEDYLPVEIDFSTLTPSCAIDFQ